MNDRFQGKIQQAWQPRRYEAQKLDFGKPLRLRLTRWISWDIGRKYYLRMNLGWCIHEPEDPESAKAFLTILKKNDATVEELARKTGCTLETTRTFADEMFRLGALQVISFHGVPPLLYYDHAINLARIHATVLGLMEIRHGLMHNSETRRLFLGILVEEYHFICAAASHISAAISNNSSESNARMFSYYLSEEYWHGKWVEQGLRAAGFQTKDLEAASPLPSTLALINLLRWAGASDLLAYCLYMGLSEGRADAREAIAEDWEAFFRQNHLSEDIFGPFYEHSLLDAEQNHGNLFREPFAEQADFSLGQRKYYKKWLLHFIHAYKIYYEGILNFYGTKEGPDYFSLQ